MKNLAILSKEEVSPETQEIYGSLESKVGMVPNIYAVTANSHHGLKAMLTFDEILKQGELSSKEVETVALAVGQTNNCQYCLSAHTAVGKMTGLTEDQTLEIRNGNIEDQKLKALSDLAKEITETRGYPGDNTISAFFEAGYNKAALVEVIGLVSLNTFTNYINHISDTDIDFPVAKELATSN